MTTRFGQQFSGTDPLKKADGQVQNAGGREFKNGFNLATEGGTVGPYLLGRLAQGNAFTQVELLSSANLSAINFTVGTIAAPTKYVAATAGPNASVVTLRPPLAALDPAPNVDPEDVYLFASANMPGAGIVKTRLMTTHR
jgi:L-asparaginase/Glu-tRNA(Gln) amidotransferase subunit D